MKILVFADLHEDMEAFEVLKEKSRQVEIILGSGDYSLFGHNLRKILQKINGLGKKCYLIHGNHESVEEMESAIKGFENLEFIHKKQVKHKKHTITGYGGDGFSDFDEEAEQFFSTMHTKGGIILFHGPPFGTLLDDVGYGNVGNESYTKIIEEQKPILVICGHIHENFGKTDKLGETILINPGPEGVILDV